MSFYPHTPLSGIFGEPLQRLADLCAASATYRALNAAGTVELYQRAPEAIEPGDCWIEIGYVDSEDRSGLPLSGRRTNADAGTSGYALSRRLSLVLVVAYATSTNEDKAALVNLAGAIAGEILAADTLGLVNGIELLGLVLQTDHDPRLLGARLAVTI